MLRNQNLRLGLVVVYAKLGAMLMGEAFVRMVRVSETYEEEDELEKADETSRMRRAKRI